MNLLEIIEPDNDYNDNNNVNNDDIILREENVRLKKENKRLKQQMEATLKQNMVLTERLGFACNHYTGFPTNERLSAVYEFLNPGINGENVIMYDNQVNERFSGGTRRAMLPFTCLLMTLIRLRKNFTVKHLAFLFQVADSTISNTFNTWINFIYLRLGSNNIWARMEQVQESVPNP